MPTDKKPTATQDPAAGTPPAPPAPGTGKPPDDEGEGGAAEPGADGAADDSAEGDGATDDEAIDLDDDAGAEDGGAEADDLTDEDLEDEAGAEGDQDADNDEGEPAGDQPDGSAPPPPAKPASPADLKAFYSSVADQAKARVKEITGEEYDELNPTHHAILAGETSKIVTRHNRESEAKNQALSIIQGAGDGFADFLADKALNITVREERAQKEAEARGDFGPSLAFIEKAAKEFKAKGAARKKAEGINRRAAGAPEGGAGKPKPPKTMSPGNGSGQRQPSTFSQRVVGAEELGFKL